MIGAAQERTYAVLKAVLNVFLGHFEKFAHQVAQCLSIFLDREVSFTKTKVTEIIAADLVGIVSIQNWRGEFIHPLISCLDLTHRVIQGVDL